MTSTDYNEWYHDVIRFYRDLEFFVDGDFAGLSDLECLQILSWPSPDNSQEEFEKLIRLGRQKSDEEQLFSEVCFLSTDKNRVIWIDPEGVWEFENFYRDLLIALGRISRNLFHPTEVVEEWVRRTKKEDSRIYISFSDHGERYTFETESMGDYGSELFLALINELILHTGQKFRLYENPGDWYIICQSDEEVLKMLGRGFSIRNPVFLPEEQADRTIKKNNSHWALVWLYIQRGKMEFRNGNSDRAWEIWKRAAEIGDKNHVYATVHEIIDQKDYNYFF